MKTKSCSLSRFPSCFVSVMTFFGGHEWFIDHRCSTSHFQILKKVESSRDKLEETLETESRNKLEENIPTWLRGAYHVTRQIQVSFDAMLRPYTPPRYVAEDSSRSSERKWYDPQLIHTYLISCITGEPAMGLPTWSDHWFLSSCAFSQFAMFPSLPIRTFGPILPFFACCRSFLAGQTPSTAAV